MYKIIGTDQKEYGPITSDQVRQWIAEGRLNAQSPAQAEGVPGWKPLSMFPEFADMLPQAPIGGAPAAAIPPAPSFGGGDARAVALGRVSGPAIGMMIAAGLSLAVGFLNLILTLLGQSLGSFGPSGQNAEAERLAEMMSGTVGIIQSILCILLWSFVIFGALKMKKLESFGLCIAASIAAMMPCMCPCCFIGLAVGIWALVVLNQPEVKSQFS